MGFKLNLRDLYEMHNWMVADSGKVPGQFYKWFYHRPIYFFIKEHCDGTLHTIIINGARYLNMLQMQVLPKLNWLQSDDIIFQHDGACLHNTATLHRFLMEIFRKFANFLRKLIEIPEKFTKFYQKSCKISKSL